MEGTWNAKKRACGKKIQEGEEEFNKQSIIENKTVRKGKTFLNSKSKEFVQTENKID